MEGVVLFLHIVVCILLVIIVLLQSGKSADLAGAFGGVGSQSTFGPRGAATFLSKMTTTLAILFMVTSLTLWIMAAKKGGSKTVLGSEDIKQEQKAETKEQAPVNTPAPTPTPAPAENK
ncbi:MAG: preprotein translocase subunit SecG [Acidobacteria bacterium]|nr:preprotein translocase subunit SecG [Acidobacteriota bacterium]